MDERTRGEANTLRQARVRSGERCSERTDMTQKASEECTLSVESEQGSVTTDGVWVEEAAFAGWRSAVGC